MNNLRSTAVGPATGDTMLSSNLLPSPRILIARDS
jgi:hypothetical protein